MKIVSYERILCADSEPGHYSARKARNRTPMPSYQGTFSDSEMSDVIAYLLSLRGLP
jgi:mono/diheme cytochrome c family protein